MNASEDQPRGSTSRINLEDQPRKMSEERWQENIEIFQRELNGQNPELLQSLKDADFLKQIPRIDRIAVTEGPGLEPALWVGINFAIFLSRLWDIPLLPIDHMEGHILGSLLPKDIVFGHNFDLMDLSLPAIALLISGGHTELVKIDKRSESDKPTDSKTTKYKYTIIGATLDDAVGEAFDKCARLLELPYPGGPHISRLAHEAEKRLEVGPLGSTSRTNLEDQPRLPRPMINSGDLNFSFAGLKTAVLYSTRKAVEKGIFDNDYKISLALEFEMAVTETLVFKTKKAIEKIGAKALILGGGVSANSRIRKAMEVLSESFSIHLFKPSEHVSGDNALMIALAGSMKESSSYTDRIIANGTKDLEN
jgi:N6-L-threonylcarbamoyladenine synthase